MKQLLSIILCLCAISVYATHNKVDSLRARIAHLDSVYITTPSKQQKDSLLALVHSYRVLDTLLTQKVEQQTTELNKYAIYVDYLFLLSEDTTIFSKAYTDDFKVPLSLSYHFETIKMIIDARLKIEKIEQAVIKIKEALKSVEVKELHNIIASQIEEDMSELDEILQKIENRDLSTLSKSQYKYFKPNLTERYNNFIKFFE